MINKTGLVVASFGRHCVVECEDGQRVICHPRGKKSQVVVGDKVQWLPSEDEGTIESIDERRNLFYRQDEIRTKSFASNLDQILIFIAAEPDFSEGQLTRALITAAQQGITPIIVLNKSDLKAPFAKAWTRLQPYRDMGYQVEPVSIKFDANVEKLTALLQGKKTLVLGPSSAGKSTLTNLLAPHAQAATAEISQALHSGKHTTTSTTLYWLDAARTTALIDSPGFQEFGLHHIKAMQLASLMPDISAHADHCKFYNCTHLHEPHCGVIDEIGRGISDYRYRLYGELFAELSSSTRQ